MKLETVFKNKPFDAIRNAVEARMGHAVPKQQTRDELAELLARYVLGNLDLWVGSWICALDDATARIVRALAFVGPQILYMEGRQACRHLYRIVNRIILNVH